MTASNVSSVTSNPPLCATTDQRGTTLPVVLLGICSAFKEDLQATTAELVYGESLRLSGELTHGPSLNGELDPTQFVDRLRHIMAQIRPTAAARHAKPRVFVLQGARVLLARSPSRRRHALPPYLGPYKVAKCDAKTFVILIGDKEIRVSIDRLKPAFILDDGSTDRSGLCLIASASQPEPPTSLRHRQKPVPMTSPRTRQRPTPMTSSRPRHRVPAMHLHLIP